jgi:hypothetical protein
VSVPSTAGVWPSVTVYGTVRTVPLGTSGSASSVTRGPDIVAPSPPGTAPSVNRSSSSSGSLAKRPRSTAFSSPAATWPVGAPGSGGRFSGGSTVMGSVSTASVPSRSSGPEPSVTSNVTDAGPV